MPAADLAASISASSCWGGVVYVRTTHDTPSGDSGSGRFGFWAHLRYSLPRIPVEITFGYRIASYRRAPTWEPRRRRRPPMRSLMPSFGLLYHTFGVTVRPTGPSPLHLGLNYTITTEQSFNVRQRPLQSRCRGDFQRELYVMNRTAFRVYVRRLLPCFLPREAARPNRT